MELIRGWATIRPTPWTRHQQCLGNLTVAIDGFLRQQSGSTAKIYRGPLDVRLFAIASTDYQTTTVVLPDLFVVHNQQQVDEVGCVGAPAWVVEIVSPGTIDRDTRTKFQLYAEAGVTEYWLVYSGERVVLCCVLAAGSYTLVGEYYEAGPIPSATLPELAVEWADIFEDLLLS